jgi:hypothetical protein
MRHLYQHRWPDMKIRIIIAILLFSFSAKAQTQPTVRQSGSVTTGHMATWSSNQILQDGGAAPSSNVIIGTSAAVTNPQISGDATSGLFSAAGSTVSIATGGIAALTINASQQVGIGTATMANTEDVYGSFGVGNNAISSILVTGVLTPNLTGIYVYSGTYNTKPYYTGPNGYIWWGSNPNWFISPSLGVQNQDFYANGSGSSTPTPPLQNTWGSQNGASGTLTTANTATFPLTVDANGNLNTQTSITAMTSLSSPVASNLSGAAFSIITDSSGGAGAFINMPTSGPSALGDNGTDAWVGYVHQGNQWLNGSSPGDIAYRNTGGRLIFGNVSGGNIQLDIASNGITVGTTFIANNSVGIGTSLPGYPLDVQGNSATALNVNYGINLLGGNLVGGTAGSGVGFLSAGNNFGLDYLLVQGNTANSGIAVEYIPKGTNQALPFDFQFDTGAAGGNLLFLGLNNYFGQGPEDLIAVDNASSAGAPWDLVFRAAGNNVGWGNAGNALIIKAGTPTNTLFLNSSGQVGIGTSLPSNPLTVIGNINSTGTVSDSVSTLVDASGTGLSKSAQTLNSNAVWQASFQPGLLTAITNTVGVYGKVSKASTVDNMIASSILLTCLTNPTVTMYECGTSTTCASPTTIASVQVTATGTATPATVSNPAITAGDYVGFAISAGSCTSLDISATAQIHSN